MALCEPVAGEDGVVILGISIGDWDEEAAVDAEAAEASGSTLQP